MLDQDTARALLELADAVGARVALVGDRHQLPAVGRGGVLDLAARYASEQSLTLQGVHRFADPAYADLSLRMRLGEAPGEVFDALLARGDVVIHASDVERLTTLAAVASRGDLVVADAREQVARINGLVHQVRVSTGEATDGNRDCEGGADRRRRPDRHPPQRRRVSASPTARPGPSFRATAGRSQ